MKRFKFYIGVLFTVLSATAFAKTIQVSGKVSDQYSSVLANADVLVDGQVVGKTSADGSYSIAVEGSQEHTLGLQVSGYSIEDKQIPVSEQNIQLDINAEENGYDMGRIEVKVPVKKNNSDASTTTVDTKDIKNTPTLTGGVEDVLKGYPGVNSNSELSSQFMVRGGNFDENQAYINGFEVFRPTLLRNGQQEGMSIINPALVENINFSAGGFEARYGDKMSSVLDVTYKKPKEFELSAEASLLGVNIATGFTDKSKKLSGVAGVRYRDMNLILNTLDEDTNFDPKYFDAQSYVRYDFSNKANLSFLATYASNKYTMIPKTKTVSFGTANQPIDVDVYYDGKEKDKYEALNTALNFEYKPSIHWRLNAGAFAYKSNEQENINIGAAYIMHDISKPDDIEGGQADHVDNNLDALVTGVKLNARYIFDGLSFLEGGFQLQGENVDYSVDEWQYLLSGDNYVQYPNMPHIGKGEDYYNYYMNYNHHLKSNRYIGYVQYTKGIDLKKWEIRLNAGVRFNHWTFNERTDVSPRFQISAKPYWADTDMTFRFATGIYYQSPFMKEMISLEDGSLNRDIKSQKSVHFILGHDYVFNWKDTPFKITTELYYKKLDNLIPYYTDNMRVVYTGENSSKGYSYGIDTRINAEFFEDAQSWLSISYSRTKENIEGRGYIPRSTDQRLSVGLFFQDYMKDFPRLRASVNLLYSAGLHGGGPVFSDLYQYKGKLPDYKRVDVGLSYVFADQKLNKAKEGTFFSNFNEFSLGLEIFNIFNMQNIISNSWIQDVSSAQPRLYSVPNRLTGRFFNVKLQMKL